MDRRIVVETKDSISIIVLSYEIDSQDESHLGRLSLFRPFYLSSFRRICDDSTIECDQFPFPFELLAFRIVSFLQSLPNLGDTNRSQVFLY